MFGIKFIKVQPTTYLLQYRGGKIVREGLGLSFFYYAPTTSLVAVPVASADVPFIFQETTADFQAVTIQGQVTYRVGEPKRLAALLNYTLQRDPAQAEPWRIKYAFLSGLGFWNATFEVIEAATAHVVDPDLLISYGYTLQRLGRRQEAVRHLMAARL